MLSRKDLRNIVLLMIASCLCHQSEAQPASTRLLGQAPSAAWIAHPDDPGDVFGVFHFRRVFTISEMPEQFIVHVSADNRYRLFINGRQVSSGPQRSDLMHWRYETVDLAPFLNTGRNILAALVWNWGPYRPVAQFSSRTAFLVQGDTETGAVANTGPEWVVYHNQGYTPIPISAADVGGYYASPPGESVDGDLFPWGWQEVEFADENWTAAVAAGAGTVQPRGSNPYGEAGGWQLVPRSIPPMDEHPVRFATVRRTEGFETDDAFLRGDGALVVPARTRAVMLLDQAHLTNAFAVLVTEGGAGSTVTLTYAEALKNARGEKGNRNEIDGKTIMGVRDVFRPDGGSVRRYQTLWFRTYRYVQVEIETADEPLRILDLHGIFTAYPFQEEARFSSDLPWLADMWEMNWRGARLCAWETYFDTPYYEQLQYVGDTRIQALISLYMSGDDRLVRQAIEHYDISRIPEGITASRYPSDLGQYIPTFSLIWIAMVHDYWMHRDDPAFVRNLLPGVRNVLSWYESYIDDTGLLSPLPWWSFIDWAREWRAGVPPGARDGHSTMVSLQYVYALQRAAELEEALGNPDDSAHYKTLADRLLTVIRTLAWDPGRGLFRDDPDTAVFSQQTNTMAVLVDAVPEDEQDALMGRVLDEASLTQSTYYFSYYVFEAVRKVGLADRYIDLLAPWQEMLAIGLTTTPENPEPTRSDSHAWAAHPNYGLLATVLGVRPAKPGFRSVSITPELGPLRHVAGRVPHSFGNIDVRIFRAGSRGIQAEINLPPGLDGVFIWEGQEIQLVEGKQEFEL